MGDPLKLVAAATAVLLSLGVASCGDGSDSDSPTTPTTAQERSEEEATAPAPNSAPEPDKGRSGEENSAGRKPHDDSGGGVAQFRVKGGDNSIQNFGSEASSSEFDQAAAALHAFLDARAADDWGTACEYLASELIEQLQEFAAKSEQARPSCTEMLRALSAGVPRSARREAAIADVGALRIDGERAFLLYHGARDADYAISMAREDGRWKVAGLEGLAIS